MKVPLLSFGNLDFLVLALFVACILALGFSVRLRDNSVLQFLAAGRRLSLPLFVASLVSMWYGDIIGTSESVSAYGLGTWVLFGVPYYVFAIVYALFFANRVREADQISIPERLQLKYGRPVALLGALLLFLLAVPTAHALSLGVLLESLTGWERWFCVILGTAVGASFLYKGGLLADARASLLAFLMMYVGFALIGIWCLTHFPLLPTLHAISNKDLLTWDGRTGWIYVVSMFVLGAWTFIDPGFHQRVASSATPTISRRGVLISTAFWFLFDMLSMTVALYAVALLPHVDGLELYPALAQKVLPPGIKALFFCGLLGTAISALVAYALISGATIGREIIARISSQADDRQTKLWSQMGIAAACVAAAVLAICINSIVDLWTAWAGAVIGALLIPVCASYFSQKKLDSSSAFASISLAFAVAIAWMIYGRTHHNENLEVFAMRTEAGFRIVMANSDASVSPPGTRIAIGTLLPGLVVSCLVLAVGTGIARLRKKYG